MSTKITLGKLLLQNNKLNKALKEWDSAQFEQAKKRFEEELPRLTASFNEERQSDNQEWNKIHMTLDSPEYGAKIDAAFAQKGIPFRGNFPSYEIPPFKLNFDTGGHRVSLKYGRKTEKRGCLEPDTIAHWVKHKYDKIISSPFNATQFARELIKAYEKVNIIKFSSRNIMWGNPVPLKEIYEILTIQVSSRRDMPLEVFLFNLTKLIENGSDYDQKKFEFGYSKIAGKMFILTDRQGRQSEFNTLKIHNL